MTERERFEAWAASRDGVYLNDPDDGARAAKLMAWDAWRARAAQPSPAPAQPDEAVLQEMALAYLKGQVEGDAMLAVYHIVEQHIRGSKPE